MHQPDGHGGAQVANLLGEHDLGRVRGYRRDANVGPVSHELDVLEAAVAKRRSRERGERGYGLLGVDAHARALSVGARQVAAEQLGSGSGKVERVSLDEIWLVPLALDAGDEGEFVDDVGELSRGRLDHSEVARLLLAEPLTAEERTCESGHGRKRRPQVVAREGHEVCEVPS
jgi:hypothetical protein